MFKLIIMAVTSKIVLYTSKTLKNGEHPIMIRITQDRKPKYLSTGFSCLPTLWDKKKEQPLKKHPNYKELLLLIESKKVVLLKTIMEMDTEKLDYSSEEVKDKMRASKDKKQVMAFLTEIINNLEKTNKVGNASAYKDLKRTLLRFKGAKDFSFSEVTHSFLLQLEQYLRERNLAETSISVYFRTLRSVFNKAIHEKHVKKDSYPFDEFKISKFNTDTQKRAISKEDLNKILALDLIEGSIEYDARNILIFSYYTMGTNFIDIANLKWENVTNDRLQYARAKTGDFFNFKLLAPALAIIEYYRPTRSNNYIFPIFDKEKHTQPLKMRTRLQTANKIYNRKLKAMGILVGITIPLTTYVARHSAATHMKKSGVAVSVISQAMGHESEKVTQIYLDSIENDAVDNALDSLL